MLVLNRRHGEAIIITLPDGREISLVTRPGSGGMAAIGIKAPSDLVISRRKIDEVSGP